jgi:hypothetical protein
MATTAGITLVAYLHGQVLPQMRSTMIANREVVSHVADPYADNTRLLTVSKGGISATTSPEHDTTMAQAPGEKAAVDSGAAVIAADTTSKKSVVKIAKQDALVATVPSSITITPNRVDLETGDTITIAGSFRPVGANSPDLRWYRFGFRLKRPDIKREYRLADTLKYNDPGVRVEQNADGSYTVSYRTVLDTTMRTGTYGAWFGVQQQKPMWILTFIVVAGVLSTLIYFYFSHEHKGVLGATAKVGIWFIMISFGASFGYTVMGRVSLLIGRVQFLIQDWVGSFSHIF